MKIVRIGLVNLNPAVKNYGPLVSLSLARRPSEVWGRTGRGFLEKAAEEPAPGCEAADAAGAGGVAAYEQGLHTLVHLSAQRKHVSRDGYVRWVPSEERLSNRNGLG
jgi:hypothetical protein